jgi:hypothetical protein
MFVSGFLQFKKMSRFPNFPNFSNFPLNLSYSRLTTSLLQ